MVVMALAFEIQNGIDDVLERFRAGNRSVFGDVADQEDGDRAVLCQQQELMSDFPHLRNRSGRRLDQRGENRLDGIDDNRRRLEPLDFVKNVFEICLGQQIKILGLNAQALAAQFDLPL